jgi:hypothetical protein
MHATTTSVSMTAGSLSRGGGGVRPSLISWSELPGVGRAFDDGRTPAVCRTPATLQGYSGRSAVQLKRTVRPLQPSP